jgi:DNA replication and repair protein RecF
MYLTHLSLTNFRAFTRLDLDMPRRILLLVGDNAQGKTTLLEAIYFLAAFTSTLTDNDRQLINLTATNEPLAVARLVADFKRDEHSHRTQRLEVRLILEAGGSPLSSGGNPLSSGGNPLSSGGNPPSSGGNGGARLRKEILLDGVKRPAHEAVGCFNAVIFLPQMMRIVEGGPEDRRRYINLTLAQVVPGYAQALSEYSQVLTQRNALLKQLNERGGDIDQLSYWDDLLTQCGSFLIHARIMALQEIERLAARRHHQLTHSREVLRLVYQPSYDPLPQMEGQYSLPLDAPVSRSLFTRDQIRQGFAQRLQTLRKEEIGRGVTTCGPHRDELRLLANRLDLGDFGSRGQVRTALLALKLAEVTWMKTKTGHWPVLLLDEILVELDIQRRADLLEALEECDQALLTTTDLNLFVPEFVQHSVVWKINAGQVEIT